MSTFDSHRHKHTQIHTQRCTHKDIIHKEKSRFKGLEEPYGSFKEKQSKNWHQLYPTSQSHTRLSRQQNSRYRQRKNKEKPRRLCRSKLGSNICFTQQKNTCKYLHTDSQRIPLKTLRIKDFQVSGL